MSMPLDMFMGIQISNPLEGPLGNDDLASISMSRHASNQEEEDHEEDQERPEESQDREETEERIDGHIDQEGQDQREKDGSEQVHFLGVQIFCGDFSITRPKRFFNLIRRFIT